MTWSFTIFLIAIISHDSVHFSNAGVSCINVLTIIIHISKKGKNHLDSSNQKVTSVTEETHPRNTPLNKEGGETNLNPQNVLWTVDVV